MMKTKCGTLAVSLGALALALLTLPNAGAQCGGMRKPAAATGYGEMQNGRPHLVRTALDLDDLFAGAEPVVGFWHVKFVSVGSQGIPDGAEVDAGYSQWHSDGTEIMNSGGRSPITSNFCLGVWKKVGERKYQLNHFATAWDPAGQHLIGPANIRELVTVDRDCKHFSGTFSIDQYDESGNTLAHVVGNITGARIEVDTPTQSVF